MNRKIFKKKLREFTGCTIQHDGWSCGTCFCSIESDLNLKNDIGDYWQAILDYRGDSDDYEWGIETDTSMFPELLEELYEQI